MHDARGRSTSSTRRLVSGLLASIALTVALATVVPLGWHPWCAGLTDSDPMWYVLLCYLDPPPKDPRT